MRGRANFTDRLYLGYFAGLGALILVLRHRVPDWSALLLLHLVFIALVLLLVRLARRYPTAHAWYPLAMPLFMFPEVAQLNFLFVDGWQDHHLLRLEAGLFPEPPTVWLSRFASPLVTELLQAGYLSYFFILIVVAGVLSRRTDRSAFFGVMAASALSYLVCYVVFITFPTEGPARTLRHLHTVPITGGPFHWLVNFVQRAGVHGNAFPSAHVAGAVAPLVFAWRFTPRLGAWLTLPVILLCIGAVYDRYHYASDVLAGIPVGVLSASFVLLALSRPAWSGRLGLSLER